MSCQSATAQHVSSGHHSPREPGEVEAPCSLHVSTRSDRNWYPNHLPKNPALSAARLLEPAIATAHCCPTTANRSCLPQQTGCAAIDDLPVIVTIELQFPRQDFVAAREILHCHSPAVRAQRRAREAVNDVP